jgi:ribosomal protein S18 acetylase RimI-like enzyme
MEVRQADASEAADLATMLGQAFAQDPVWSWAFPDAAARPAQLARWFGLIGASALGHRSAWVTSGLETATVWFPPGCPELDAEGEEQLVALVGEMMGPRAPVVLEIFDRFEAAHPHEQDHHYLSLFGTAPDHRGRGVGMELLRANLAALDAAGQPAYLESTNPANLARYQSVGFEVCGRFELPDDCPSVTMMWRDPR